ncbi:hypothetical protein BH23BAC1_BH23BAC1_36280 [soil metagenome]
MLQSLDPRVNRLNIAEKTEVFDKPALDQFETYQVFLQIKEGKAYEHAGIVHAPDGDFALLFAKEQFSRRPNCTGLWVVKTQDVKATPYLEREENIYNYELPAYQENLSKEHFEIFHLKKRGKQHIHQGSVLAGSYEEGLHVAKMAYNTDGPILNVWIIKEADILSIKQEDKDIWETLSEKVHRSVISYKAMDKIKKFKEENNLI